MQVPNRERPAFCGVGYIPEFDRSARHPINVPDASVHSLQLREIFEHLRHVALAAVAMTALNPRGSPASASGSFGICPDAKPILNRLSAHSREVKARYRGTGNTAAKLKCHNDYALRLWRISPRVLVRSVLDPLWQTILMRLVGGANEPNRPLTVDSY